jgi:hypothetical protein
VYWSTISPVLRTWTKTLTSLPGSTCSGVGGIVAEALIDLDYKSGFGKQPRPAEEDVRAITVAR